MTCTRSARRHRAGEYWLGDVLVQRHNYQTNRRLEMTFPRLCTPPDEGRRPPRGPRSGKAFYSITLLSCGAPRTAGCTAWERRTVIKSSAAWKRLVGKLEEWKPCSLCVSGTQLPFPGVIPTLTIDATSNFSRHTHFFRFAVLVLLL